MSVPNPNQIIDYFAYQQQGQVHVLRSRLPVDSSVARDQWQQQQRKKGLPEETGAWLRVCYDRLSGRLYLPETKAVPTDGPDQALFEAVQIRAQKDFGIQRIAPPVMGDPFTSFRLKTLSNYPFSWRYLQRVLDKARPPDDLPVVEADLSRIPRAREILYSAETASSQGGYAGRDLGTSVQFFEMLENGGERLIHSQQTPFLWVDLSEQAGTHVADKDRILISAYREGLQQELGDGGGDLSSAKVYSLQFLLYIGWDVTHICEVMFAPARVKNMEDLLEACRYIEAAARQFEEETGRNPTLPHFYYSFQVTPQFSMRLAKGPLRIVEFDPRSSWMVVESPFYFNDEVCHRLLGANLPVVRGRLSLHWKQTPEQKEPHSFQFENDPAPLQAASTRLQPAMLHSAAKQAGIAFEDMRVRLPETIDRYFTRKRISDFPQTRDLLLERSAAISRVEKRPIPFQDLELILGPWSEMMQMAGGYIYKGKDKDGKQDDRMKLGSWVLQKPFIAIDTLQTPNVAEWTRVIIHEYNHHVWVAILGKPIKQYQIPTGQPSPRWMAETYLPEPTETSAHVDHIKHMLAIGMSGHEVLLHHMKGTIASEHLPLARAYQRLIDKAEREMEQDADDDPQAELTRTQNE